MGSTPSADGAERIPERCRRGRRWLKRRESLPLPEGCDVQRPRRQPGRCGADGQANLHQRLGQHRAERTSVQSGVRRWSALLRKSFNRDDECAHDPTATSVFHFTASLFGSSVTFRNSTPEEQIRQLRNEGLTIAEIVAQVGVSERVVRRVVGKVERTARRQEREEIAREIDGEAISWVEKVARWREQTGLSETSFWRALRRCGRSG